MRFKPNNNKLLITPAEGYTPHIGILVSTLQRCRETTIGLVENLSVAQLDYLFDDQDNSIGALLLHIASLDVAYSEITFRGRNFLDVPELVTKWQVPGYLDEPARQQVRGNPASYYVQEMAAVRKATLAQLKQYDDSWLWRETEEGNGLFINNYYNWYHVYEDEINHRGEMNWRLSRMKISD
jgi:DinB superfamily